MEQRQSENESINTVVIGAGQAGLSVGYYLKKRGVPFVILEANERVGDSWRKRWDSLRLFTMAMYDGIAGMRFPGPRLSYPSKDQMADYLESYAAHFELPIRTGVRVEKLERRGERFLLTAGGRAIEAENVVVAMATYQSPRIPSYATELNPEIRQMHSLDYRNPSQLREGDVLIVGAANSGAEIALDIAKEHRTWLSGRDVGYVPFRTNSLVARLFLVHLLFRIVFHRILTMATPLGRRIRAKMLAKGDPLIRIKPGDLKRAGIQRAARVVGVRGGKPLLVDGTVLDVANVIWCTGFHPGFTWIHLPIFNGEGVEHRRGVVEKEPGLYFVGLRFLYAFSSTMIQGVSRDAGYIARAIAARSRPASEASKQRYTEVVRKVAVL